LTHMREFEDFRDFACLGAVDGKSHGRERTESSYRIDYTHDMSSDEF
jgi:hypothetical protein